MRTFTPLLLTCLLNLAFSALGQSVLSTDNYIRVDQFGYLPSVNKVAVIAKPLDGFNKEAGLLLNVGVPVDLVDQDSKAVVFSAFAKTWNGGAKDELSGDIGYWFDFSSVTRPGTYVIRATQLDGATVTSYPFRIATDVYEDVLRASINFFYYQRVNQDKTANFAAGAPWTDGPWFARANQEKAAKLLDNPSVTRDLSGGWIDAGDPNKYVTFATDPVHSLLRTYTDHPAFWKTFDLRIPESGNAIPDILDEVQWEIEWIKKMQDFGTPNSSGGIHQKMGILNDGAYISPPSSDTRLRYYNQVCVSSTITGAGMFAHAATIYKGIPSMQAEATVLIARAEAAWKYYKDAPNKTERCDDGRIEAGDADGPGDQYAIEHLAEATVAAIYLFEATGKAEYRTFVEDNYRQMRPFKGSAAEWAVYRTAQGEAIADYAARINPTSAAARAVRSLKEGAAKSESSAYRVFEADNIYRANLVYFNWGSNSLAGAQASQIMDFLAFGWRPELAAAHTERAASIVNYIHGTNPMGLCYLSNMYRYGGDLCADEMWHSWFGSGTKYDNITGDNVGPAPGFLAGGANPQGNGAMPIKIGTEQFRATVGGQPKQKAFSVNNDANATFGPWAYNEPAIYYNANYVRALAFFAAGEVGGADEAASFGATGECFEAEAVTTNRPAATGQVGTSGGFYLAATGAATRSFSFTPTSTGPRQITLRVALGSDRSTVRKSLERYTLTLGGQALALQLDSTTLAAAASAGGTIWGTAVSAPTTLRSGSAVALQLTTSGAAGVDLLCYREVRSVPLPPTPGGGGGAFDKCLEIESNFTATNDVGQFAVAKDVFTKGYSGDGYVNIFDIGDEATVKFESPRGGKGTVKVRLRVGEKSGTDRNLATAYVIKVNGATVSTTLVESSISELFDDTYWGDMSGEATFVAGENTLSISGTMMWLKIDQACVAIAGTGPAAAVCAEAEDAFEVLAEAGVNAFVERDGNSPGSSGSASVKLFDAGDEVRLNFKLAAAGSYTIRVRVRTGESSANSATNLRDEYRFALDGTEMTTVLDEATLSDLSGDTYWGELVVGPMQMVAGDHTLDVRAKRNWLKLDRFCIQEFDASGVAEVPAGVEVRLSPNPVRGLLTVALTGDLPTGDSYKYELTDASGRILARVTGSREEARFDVGRSASAGLHTLRVTNVVAGWSIARQVIVQ